MSSTNLAPTKMSKVKNGIGKIVPKKVKKMFGGGEAISDPVTVVRLSGAIGNAGRFSQSLSLESVGEQLEQAFKPKNLSAVALLINSPGGSPVQSSLIGKRIRALAEEKAEKRKDGKPVPVIAFVEDVAASGGYWLACAGDEIYIDESSMVGSIGVIAAGYGFTDAIKKLGVERRTYTAGENKLRLDPFQKEKKEDVVWVKELQGQIHEVFRDWVRGRRGDKLVGTDEDLMNGNVWIGQKAVDNGLVDGLGDLRSVLKSKFGKEVPIKVIGTKKSLGQKLGLGMSLKADELASEVVNVAEERMTWNRFGI